MRAIILGTLVSIMLLQSGCWQALAARRAEKRIQDGNGPVGQMVDGLEDDGSSSNSPSTYETY